MSDRSGVYNFLVNLSLRFNKTNADQSINNVFNRIKQSLDKVQKSAGVSASSLTGGMKQVNKAMTEASKRASYFDTIWGKMFSVMMKVYSIRFFAQIIGQIGSAFYKASISAQKFDRQIIASFGHSKEGMVIYAKIIKYANQYGETFTRVAQIVKSLQGLSNVSGIDLTEPLIKLGRTFDYGADFVDNVIDALTRMANTGKVSISDLNDLARSGVYVWETLKKELNMTDDELRNIEKSGIDVNKVITILSKEIVKMADNQLTKVNTLETALNNVKNSWELFKKGILNLPKDNALTQIINWINTIIKKIIDLLHLQTKEPIRTKEEYETTKKRKQVLSDQTDYIAKQIEAAMKKLVNDFLDTAFEFGKNWEGHPLKNYPNIKEQISEKAVKELVMLFKTEPEKFFQTLSSDFRYFLEDILKLVNKEAWSTHLKAAANLQYTSGYSGIKKLGDMSSYGYSYGKNFMNMLKTYSDTYMKEMLELYDLLEKIKIYETEQDLLKDNAPKTITEATTQTETDKTIKDFETYFDEMLSELLYNIEYNIKNVIDGIIKDLEGITNSIVNIGEFDVRSPEEVKKAFQELLSFAYEEISNIMSMMVSEGADQEELYKKLMVMQNQYSNIVKEYYSYVEEQAKKQLEYMKQLEEAQAEINSKNVFYKILLNIDWLFDTIKKEIKVVNELTGEVYSEIVDTGIPKLKDNIELFINRIIDNFKSAINGNYLSPKMLFQGLGDSFNIIFQAIFNGAKELVNNIGNIIGVGLLSALSQVQGIQALIDPFTYMIQVIADRILPTLNDLLTPLIGFLTTIAMIIGDTLIPALGGAMGFIQQIAQYLAITLSNLMPLFQALGLILQQVIQLGLLPLTIIFKALNPILQALRPVFMFFAKIIWFVGFVVNGVARAIIGTINIFITILKALGAKINTIPMPEYQSYQDFNNMISSGGVSVAEMTQNAYNPTSQPIESTDGSSGANYTTSAQRSISVVVNVENWFGDETATRKLALIVKNEFQILGVL